jgi:ABC-2 type transport system permease protein
MQQYSQLQAMLAITKAGLRTIFRSPSAVVFGFFVPFIFIVVFGFIGNSGGVPVYKIVISADSDTTNALYDSIKTNNRFKLVTFKDSAALRTNLEKGRIAGVLTIKKTNIESPACTYKFSSTTASGDKWPQVLPLLEAINTKISNKVFSGRPSYAVQNGLEVEELRQYRTIDFILPGQLGFSLMSSGVFGVAFMFFGLRNTLVLKRFFATPIQRTYIVLGEAIARVVFQMITAIVILLIGHWLFKFTLIYGVITFLQLLVLSFIGLLVFMGFGFIISGVAKNDSTIPMLSNLITLPQFLLGGTFFGVEAFPKWLQLIAKALPLTHLNTAMRAVAFEGQNLWDVKNEIGILLLWGVIVYAIAIKVFKWE